MSFSPDIVVAGGGFALGPSQNVFNGADRAAAETSRDNYATANSSWLASYNSDTNLNIRLEYSDGGNNVALYQVRNSVGDAWLDNSSAIGVKGDSGEASTTLNVAYVNGPEITTSALNGPVVFKVGSSSDTDEIQVYKNIAGDAICGVRGDGNAKIGGGNYMPWAGGFAGQSFGGGGFSIAGNTSSTSGFVASNVYFDGANWRYVKDGPATVIAALGASGSATVYIAPLGTSGSIATLSEVFSVSQSGIKCASVQTFADDAAAGAGGLSQNTIYKTSTGEIRIKL